MQPVNLPNAQWRQQFEFKPIVAPLPTQFKPDPMLTKYSQKKSPTNRA